MRFSTAALLLAVAILAALDHTAVVSAKKPSRPSSSSSRRGPPKGTGSSRRPPVSKRRYEEEEGEDESGYNDPYDEEVDEEDEDVEPEIEVDFEDDVEEEEEYRPKPRKSKARGGSQRPGIPKKKAPSSRKGSSKYYDEEDEYDRPPRRPKKGGLPPRGRGPPPRRGRGRVVPYTQQTPSSFTRGLEALRKSMPDPSSVKDAAVKSLNVARETTSSLSANLYREVKGLTSSELEQVMLKATRPDDTPVKGKHAERLVGVTYQISGRYDIYDAVLRKLWAKMAEKDWRTTIKALYILHRFSADGSPEHAAALKVGRYYQNIPLASLKRYSQILTRWTLFVGASSRNPSHT
jgi:ANTH domain